MLDEVLDGGSEVSRDGEGVGHLTIEKVQPVALYRF